MSGDRIAERAAAILAAAATHPRILALPEADREQWARAQAEKELATVPYLPGKLSWAQIEKAYRELAASPPGQCVRPPVHQHRRASPSQPSRPEVAHKLDRAPETIDRACRVAGKGEHWPPLGI